MTNSASFDLAPREPGGTTNPPYQPTVEAVRGLVAGAITSTPQGVILHGSRSGRDDYGVDQEYTSTVGYVSRGTDGTVGWHATVGTDRVAVHMTPKEYGWNARGASKTYLGVEFAQPTLSKPISDGQVNAFCWWFANVARAAWPSLPLNFPTHSELPEGVQDGKTDVFTKHSAEADELRARIMARLGL